MFWAGQKVKNPLASKLASAFRLFDPGIIIIKKELPSPTEGCSYSRSETVT